MFITDYTNLKYIPILRNLYDITKHVYYAQLFTIIINFTPLFYLIQTYINTFLTIYKNIIFNYVL